MQMCIYLNTGTGFYLHEHKHKDKNSGVLLPVLTSYFHFVQIWRELVSNFKWSQLMLARKERRVPTAHLPTQPTPTGARALGKCFFIWKGLVEYLSCICFEFRRRMVWRKLKSRTPHFQAYLQYKFKNLKMLFASA